MEASEATRPVESLHPFPENDDGEDQFLNAKSGEDQAGEDQATHGEGVQTENTNTETQVVQYGTLGYNATGQYINGSVGAPTFTNFTRLPAKLRNMIWKFALPAPRKLILAFCRSHRIEPRLFPLTVLDGWMPTDRKMPLASVCKDSRKFIMNFGYTLKTLYAPNDKTKMWICEGRDRVSESRYVTMDPQGNYNYCPSDDDDE